MLLYMFSLQGKDKGLYLMYLMTWYFPSLKDLWNLPISEGEYIKDYEDGMTD